METFATLCLALLFYNVCISSRMAEASHRNLKTKPTRLNKNLDLSPTNNSTETEGTSQLSSTMWTSSDATGWTSSSPERGSIVIVARNDTNQKNLRGKSHQRSKSIQMVNVSLENSNSSEPFSAEEYQKSEKSESESEIERKLGSLSLAIRPNSGRKKAPSVHTDRYLLPVEEKYDPRRRHLYYGSSDSESDTRRFRNEVEWNPPRNFESDTSSGTSAYPPSSPYSGNASYTSVSSDDQPEQGEKGERKSKQRRNIPKWNESKDKKTPVSPKVLLPVNDGRSHSPPGQDYSPNYSSCTSCSYPSSLTYSGEVSDHSVSSDDQQVQQMDAKTGATKKKK